MARKTAKNENPTYEDMCNANYKDRISVVRRLGEIWKPLTIAIPDLQEYYYISNYGRVYSSYSNSLLTPKPIGRGYLVVRLRTKDNRGIDALVHRLVMMTFEPIINPDDFQVNHINGIKTNNYYDNLEWVTQSENMLHAYKLGLRLPGENNNFCLITEDKAKEICRLLESKKYMIKEIAKMVNLEGHEALIFQIKLRHNWKHISKDYDF